MLLGQPIRQIAYLVDDVREAARNHSSLFGSGPFFVREHMVLEVTHRGRRGIFDHTAAFGQWGDVQVELLQPHTPGPSILTDLYPEGSGRTGIHHVALIVNDLKAALVEMAAKGYELALHARSASTGLEGVMVDAVKDFGHFIELYEPTPRLAGFYRAVAEAAVGFDGRDPVRELTEP
jgi:catechol 2,3-dioxygenase-like lactoylglutathione lyase family enzyme